VLFETIGSFLVERLYNVLPRWLDRRMLPLARVQGDILINLRRENGLYVQGGEVPSVSVTFEVDNRSPIDITLDRLLLEVWFGQPTFRGAILNRYDIPRRTKNEQVFFWTAVTAEQVAQIKRAVLVATQSAVTLNVRAYFTSRLGWLTVEARLSQQHTQVTGLG
jgi:hypothetical protein